MVATNLRFRYRHVHATLYRHIRDQMIALGWGNTALPGTDPVNDHINFDAPPVTWRDFQPDEAGETVQPQTIVVTLGDEDAREDLELGAGLAQVTYPLFVDCYGYNQAVAQAVMGDLKDILEDLAIPVLDFTVSPPAVTALLLEIWHEDVQSGRPESSIGAQDFKRYWRALTASVRCEYIA